MIVPFCSAYRKYIYPNTFILIHLLLIITTNTFILIRHIEIFQNKNTIYLNKDTCVFFPMFNHLYIYIYITRECISELFPYKKESVQIVDNNNKKQIKIKLITMECDC